MILLNIGVGQQLALDNVLGVGDAILVDCLASGQLDRLLTDCARNGELIVANRRGGRLKTCTDLDSRVHANRNRDGERLAQRLGLLAEGTQVTGARGEEHGDGIRALQAQAVNSYVVFTGLDVMGVAHAHRDVGAGVLLGIGGSGHQLAHVEARIVRHVYNFLAGRHLSLSDNLRSDGVRNGVIEHEAQSLRVAIEQVTHAATTGEQADRHACAWMALHVVEYHRGPLFSGTRYRTTGADMAVYTGKLRHRIHFNIGFDKLTVNALEQLKSATQIVDLIRHCSSNSASCYPTMQTNPAIRCASPTQGSGSSLSQAWTV